MCAKLIHIYSLYSAPDSPAPKASANGHANPTFQLKKPDADKPVICRFLYLCCKKFLQFWFVVYSSNC